MTAIKVLVDRNIEVIQTTTDNAIQKSKIKWGDITIDTDLPGYLKKDYSKINPWKMSQIKCLPSIKKAVDNNILKLHTYSEIEQERHKFEYIRFGDILGYDFTRIKPAIERSFFRSYRFSELYNRQLMIDFCLFILENKIEEWGIRQFKQMGLSDFYINNIFNLERFREICKNILPNPDEHDKLCDAFHLWTAEVNKMDYFLTVDKKFINKLVESSNIQFFCIPIAPKDLLEEIGIKKIEPWPLIDNKFYPLYLVPPFNEEKPIDSRFLQPLFRKTCDYAKRGWHRLFSLTGK